VHLRESVGIAAGADAPGSQLPPFLFGVRLRVIVVVPLAAL
jgi:hypothetical protein